MNIEEYQNAFENRTENIPNIVSTTDKSDLENKFPEEGDNENIDKPIVDDPTERNVPINRVEIEGESSYHGSSSSLSSTSTNTSNSIATNNISTTSVNTVETEGENSSNSIITYINDANNEVITSSEEDEGDEVNEENEVEDIEEISDTEEQLPQKKKKTKNKSDNTEKKKRKRKKAGMRKNIRNVFSDAKLDEKTQKLREFEKERLKRLGIDILTKGTVSSKPTSVIKTGGITKKTPPSPPPPLVRAPIIVSKQTDVICLDSDSDQEIQEPPAKKIFTTSHRSDIVILSSDSDEDDDESTIDEKKAQSDDYYSELGLHTNDALNVADDRGRILVNVNHTNKDEDIFLHPSIGNILKPHQIGGVRFLYDNLIETVSGFRSDEGNGCILAHAMGLGKTIQTITFIDLFLRYTPSKKVLCVVPVNTIQNWMYEFNHWLPPLPNSKDDTKKLSKAENKVNETNKAIVKTLLEDMVEFVEYRMEKLESMEKETCHNDTQNNSDLSTMQQNVSVIQGKPNGNNPLYNVAKDIHTSEPVIAPDEKPSVEDDKIHYRTFQVFLVDSMKTQMGRARIIEDWDKVGGVLLMGYEMYRGIAMYSANKKSRGKQKKNLKDEDGDIFPRLKKAICRPGPDLVVCDEGHRIRNYQSGISLALKSIRTRKRLVLTGYPLQNNLIEYWCMVDFVRPNYLGSRQEFANMFERPIMNGQCVDSTRKDKHLMRQRAHVLYSLLEGFVQRRGHSVFKAILPDKEEHVLMVRLSPIQKALYKRLSELTKEAYNDSLNPIKTFSMCCKIWNHPDIMFIAIRASLEGQQLDISDEDDITLDDNTIRAKRKKKISPARSSPLLTSIPSTHSSPLLTSSNVSPMVQDSLLSSIGFDPFGNEARETLTDIPQWAGPIFKEFSFSPGDINNSGKFFVLKQLIDESLLCNDKMLIFSQSLLTLNTIEEMLQKMNVNGAPDKYWQKGREYFRLDGSTGSLERERLINAFNDKNNTDVKLFILSTRAGCLGINLVAANRVVVFDVSWNPCYDAQAVCRIYRYGQTKRCYIYRLVSSNTMEKKIYYRQISKIGISDRVVDEMNLTENFSKNEIQSLIVEDWVDEPLLDFKDTSELRTTDYVLLKILQKCKQWITKMPFKHESLLVDESSEKLSGSEKRAAKRAYEQERMIAQSSQVPYRTYPLQQNFPRNTPVVPVRPFLWRPPLQSSSSWPNLQTTMSIGSNVTVSTSMTRPTSDAILQLLRQPRNNDNMPYLSMSGNSSTLSTSNNPIQSYPIVTSSSSVANNILNSVRAYLSGPRLAMPVLNRNNDINGGNQVNNDSMFGNNHSVSSIISSNQSTSSIISRSNFNTHVSNQSEPFLPPLNEINGLEFSTSPSVTSSIIRPMTSSVPLDLPSFNASNIGTSSNNMLTHTNNHISRNTISAHNNERLHTPVNNITHIHSSTNNIPNIFVPTYTSHISVSVPHSTIQSISIVRKVNTSAEHSYHGSLDTSVCFDDLLSDPNDDFSDSDDSNDGLVFSSGNMMSQDDIIILDDEDE